MSRGIGELLLESDCGVSRARNPGGKLFRIILRDMCITPAYWERGMKSYLNSPRSGVRNSIERSSKKGNLNKPLSLPSLTWKKLKTGIAILNPKDIEIRLQLNWDKNIVLGTEKPEIIIYRQKASEDELLQLFRTVMVSVGITPNQWRRLVERFISKYHKESINNPPDYASIRGNIQKSLIESKSLTWGMFFKGLAILGVESGTFQLYLTWKTKTTIHEIGFKTESYLAQT